MQNKFQKFKESIKNSADIKTTKQVTVTRQ